MCGTKLPKAIPAPTIADPITQPIQENTPTVQTGADQDAAQQKKKNLFQIDLQTPSTSSVASPISAQSGVGSNV